jgi:predicted glycogen debranching enzyme
MASAPREWLVADGLGGFASGAADGIRTRRYHALLLLASPFDERRYVLVNDTEVWLERGSQGARIPLSSHRYYPGVIHPDGATRLRRFDAEPWPTWSYDAGEGREVVQQLFIPRTTERAGTVIEWHLVSPGQRAGLSLALYARVLLSGRDFHALHHENPYFALEPEKLGPQSWSWQPYAGIPPILVHANATYQHEPLWFRQFQYDEETARGLDDTEDLVSPGIFRFELTRTSEDGWPLGERVEPAVMMLTTSEDWSGYRTAGDIARECRALRESERARIAAFRSRLHHSADCYLVRRRASRRTIVAGYPWFTDWGRDTFIALRGLCLDTGRMADAEEILVSWCDTVSEGMLPNLFPSEAVAPMYNSVDASLWFVVAVQAYLDACNRRRLKVEPAVTRRLTDAVQEVLEGYARGTRYGIRMDEDGLLAAGEPGVALTWMDAIVDGIPVTPRIGKPVEVQALWINALTTGGRWSERWSDLAEEGRSSFSERFWNAERGCLYDVVDVDHVAGTVDDRVRPNQVLAVGGLRMALLAGARAQSVIDVVERELWTPMGLRTLATSDPGYRGRCEGNAVARDRAYHNGTVWPWLMGPFVDAWVRARSTGGGPFAVKALRTEARKRFLRGLARHIDGAGIGHISEIADGDDPWTPRGCPFQAWSLGEMLRMLAEQLIPQPRG